MAETALVENAIGYGGREEMTGHALLLSSTPTGFALPSSIYLTASLLLYRLASLRGGLEEED